MKTVQELQEGLRDFYGTEAYHRFSMLFRNHVLTDGVKWLCENAECFWLVDAIASYHAKCMKDKSLQGIQFWRFKGDPVSKTGTLTCERDENDIVITQNFEYQSFPMTEQKFYVKPDGNGLWVIMLPSEY